MNLLAKWDQRGVSLCNRERMCVKKSHSFVSLLLSISYLTADLTFHDGNVTTLFHWATEVLATFPCLQRDGMLVWRPCWWLVLWQCVWSTQLFLKNTRKHKVDELTGCRCEQNKGSWKGKSPSGYKVVGWKTVVPNPVGRVFLTGTVAALFCVIITISGKTSIQSEREWPHCGLWLNFRWPGLVRSDPANWALVLITLVWLELVFWSVGQRLQSSFSRVVR